MKLKDVLINLLNGDKVRRKDWKEETYCYLRMDKNGCNHWYLNDGTCIDGKYYKDMVTGEDVWEVL